MKMDPWRERVLERLTLKFGLSRQLLEQVVFHFQRATPFSQAQSALGIDAETLNKLYKSNLRRVALSTAPSPPVKPRAVKRSAPIKRTDAPSNHLPAPETVQAVADLIEHRILRDSVRKYLGLSEKAMEAAIQQLKSRPGRPSVVGESPRQGPA